jgi:hypothetical protein
MSSEFSNLIPVEFETESPELEAWLDEVEAAYRYNSVTHDQESYQPEPEPEIYQPIVI